MAELINYPNAFNGDIHLYLKIAEIRNKYNLTHAIETGTFHGQTTQALAELFQVAITIEKNETYYEIAGRNLKGIQNIIRLKGNSPDQIKDLLIYPNEDRFFFFLDAHWEAYNPLLDELRAIAGLKIKPVICIHDFFVPGKSDPMKPSGEFGFDIYDGQGYIWDWIKPDVEAIYGEGGYLIQYPEQVTGGSRGYILIYPA